MEKFSAHLEQFDLLKHASPSENSRQPWFFHSMFFHMLTLPVLSSMPILKKVCKIEQHLLLSLHYCDDVILNAYLIDLVLWPMDFLNRGQLI